LLCASWNELEDRDRLLECDWVCERERARVRERERVLEDDLDRDLERESLAESSLARLRAGVLDLVSDCELSLDLARSSDLRMDLGRGCRLDRGLTRTSSSESADCATECFEASRESLRRPLSRIATLSLPCSGFVPRPLDSWRASSSSSSSLLTRRLFAAGSGEASSRGMATGWS